jgi:ABC-type sugar transport system ATPase subunit
MTTSAPRLQMRAISKRFAGVQALDGVELEVDAGQIVALVGENGAGKSTLIKTLAGAQPPDTGQILVDGQVEAIHSPTDAERLGIATVYQELNLFPFLTVAENLLFGRLPKRRGVIDWRSARREAADFLASMNVQLDVNRRVSELSIAERQMLEIAKSLHRQVRILVLDEPTAVLGGADVDRLLDMVRSLRDRGVATIFISHRLEEIFGLADRYVVLKDGKYVGSGDLADMTSDGLVSMMVGRELSHVEYTSSRRGPEEEALRVEGLSRRGVLADISLSLRKGEVLGVAGLRGAGRTEMARAIFGADAIDTGTITVDGNQVAMRSPATAISHGIGLVPEDRKAQGLLLNLSTAENIPLVALTSGGAGRVRPRAERSLAMDYKKSLDIRVADVGSPVGTLSGGNQQKVVLAKWLEAGVSVLILDEPTRGIDVGSKREIYEIIRGLAADGVGVLLISSELPEVLEMSDRVVVMRKGRIVADLERAEATEETIMAHAVGAGSHVVSDDVPNTDAFEQALDDVDPHHSEGKG